MIWNCSSYREISRFPWKMMNEYIFASLGYNRLARYWVGIGFCERTSANSSQNLYEWKSQNFDCLFSSWFVWLHLLCEVISFFHNLYAIESVFHLPCSMYSTVCTSTIIIICYLGKLEWNENFHLNEHSNTCLLC